MKNTSTIPVIICGLFATTTFAVSPPANRSLATGGSVARPEATTSAEAVVAADIGAQNSADWGTYLKLRTDIGGAPESASNYKTLWQQGQSGIRGNVISARLESIIPVPFDVARRLIGSECYVDNLINPQAFYAIIDYKVRTEDKYICDGPNARLYVLHNENGGWKIVQVSEPILESLVSSGFALRSMAEQELLGRQSIREQTGRFINARGQVVFAAGPAGTETTHVYPTSISVAHFTAYPGCQYQNLIGCVDFITYVKNVLPNEWSSSWPQEALKAGALAAKMVGWYRVYNCKYCNQAYDVSDQECDQVYRANTAVTSTNNAISAVAGVGMDRATSGTIFYPSYSNGGYNDSGFHGGQMYQNGTHYLADHGFLYDYMVHYYYDNSSATGGQLAHLFTYTETGTGCGVGGSIDLTKSSDILSNTNPHPGDTVTASLTIRNQACSGTNGAAGPFHVGFYWSTNPNFSGVSPFYEKPLSGCAANGTVSFDQPITIDASTAPGTYYLGYKINDQTEVSECNITNNGIYYWTVNVQGGQPFPPFFNGQSSLGDNWYWLRFPSSGGYFGYYNLGSYPWINHLDMGWEYVVDANNGGGVFLYDWSSGTWFYTAPNVPFPNLYDYSVGCWLYYLPIDGYPDRYTSNPRWFYNYCTGQWFPK